MRLVLVLLFQVRKHVLIQPHAKQIRRALQFVSLEYHYPQVEYQRVKLAGSTHISMLVRRQQVQSIHVRPIKQIQVALFLAAYVKTQQQAQVLVMNGNTPTNVKHKLR